MVLDLFASSLISTSFFSSRSTLRNADLRVLVREKVCGRLIGH